MQPPLTVDVTRDGVAESTHLVDVAVVDEHGALIAGAGDPQRIAAFRSSIKPLQAAVSASLGWEPSDPRLRAIACASHNGEPAHVGTVRRLLRDAGLDESSLKCPPAWPYLPADVADAGRKRPVQHNCSGKHAAFLAACVSADLPLDTYLEPAHPLQEAIAARIAAAARMPPAATLTDGCGAPTPVFPLEAIARAFLAVAGTPEAEAMLAHPHLVAGSQRLDTAVLGAGVVTKAGAEGLSTAVGMVRADAGPVRTGSLVAVAVKARDGSIRGRTPALVGVLVQLGLLPAGAIDERVAMPEVHGGGRPVGRAQLRDRLEFG